MKAHARIVAVTDRAGATVLAQLRGEPPLLPRVTGARGGPVAEVHLVGGAAGPLGGDDLSLDVEVGPGACLMLHTVAAAVALPGPDGARSVMTVRARVAAGGRLAYLPQPMVAAAGCHHVVSSTVELDDGAQLVWREELVAGRYGEQPGRLRQQTRVRRAGVAVLAQDLTVGDDRWDSPAVVGANRACGTVVLVDDVRRTPTTVDHGALMPLADAGAWIACAVAPDAHHLRHLLDRLAPGSEGVAMSTDRRRSVDTVTHPPAAQVPLNILGRSGS